jgi:hypothetical protein
MMVMLFFEDIKTIFAFTFTSATFIWWFCSSFYKYDLDDTNIYYKRN